MITQEQFDQISCDFPLLRRADSQLVRDFQQTVFFASFPTGKDIFVEGDRADALALVLSGVVRVYKIGKMGREITLYRFGLGESRILTANAILSHQSFPAAATVEQAGQAAMCASLERWRSHRRTPHRAAKRVCRRARGSRGGIASYGTQSLIKENQHVAQEFDHFDDRSSDHPAWGCASVAR